MADSPFVPLPPEYSERIVTFIDILGFKHGNHPAWAADEVASTSGA
jgi:hypothetical protein